MISQIANAAKFALLSFRRNPASTFFTVVLPLIFLILFGFIFGSEEISPGVKVTTFQVPGILALSIISATFVNLAITTTFRRELGQLKRIRSTPMPPVAYILGQVLASLVISAFMAVLVVAAGRLLFGVSFQRETTAVFVVSIVLGAMAFAALGLAVTAIIPSQDAAPAVTNMLALPLYFISDVFILIDDNTPAVIRWIGDIFPVKHLARALQPSFDPFLASVQVPWTHWMVIAAWGIFGVMVAATKFQWSPRR